MELLKIQMQDAGRVAAQLKVLNWKFVIEKLRVLNWKLKFENKTQGFVWKWNIWITLSFVWKWKNWKKLEALFENLNLKTQGFVENLKQKKTKVLFKNLYMKKMFERWKLKIEINIELQAAGQSTAHLPKISALSLTKKLLAEKVFNT